MKRTLAYTGSLCGLVLIGGAFWLISGAERIVLRAVDTVALYDPSSLAGRIGDSPRRVGMLVAGEEIQVLECVDRKSDINIHVMFNGSVVAVGEWEARIQLQRKRVLPWQHGATSSCLGYFQERSGYASQETPPK